MALKIFLAKAEARLNLLRTLNGEKNMDLESFSNLSKIDRAKAILEQERLVRRELQTLEYMTYRSGINRIGMATIGQALNDATRQLSVVGCIFEAVVDYLENKEDRSTIWDYKFRIPTGDIGGM